MFDPLTCIGGIIKLEGGRLTQYMDIRFPTATTGEMLVQQLSAAAGGFGADYVSGRTAEPFYVPATSAPIQTLVQVYNEVTGQNKKPFTMGGGTYARHFSHAVSFGPEEMGEVKPAFAGPIHGADEGISIEGMFRALKIYILALWRLQQLQYR
ncbi:MAG: hypothetical protein ACK5L3_04415 [Oscillospiraceae bacterium]